jgi:uncharacterized protein YndB with AHSA1/START domain
VGHSPETPWSSFEGDAVIEDNVVIQEVEYPVEAERVWRALVDPIELAQWLMPNDLVPVVGGRFYMECEPVGRIEAEVLEVDPPRRLVCKWAGSFGDTVVSFVLTPVSTGTRLRVEHRGWTEDNAAARDQFNSGWPEKVAALSRLLDPRAPTEKSRTSAIG